MVVEHPGTAATRISPLRLGFLVGCVLAVVAGSFYMLSGGAAQTAAANTVPTGFAGYVDVTSTPTQHFESPTSPSLQNVILAFVVADKESPCTPSWGTYYTLDEASRDLDLDRRIEQLRVVDGNVRVSFGGAINDELSTVCTDAADLRDAYLEVIDRYKLQSIDLDIEGDDLTDQEGNARRAEAIKAVQEHERNEDRALGVWLTLPTTVDGLSADGELVLAGMLEAGVDITGVNGMTMNFGASKSETDDMSNAVEMAALRMQRQILSAYEAIGEPLSDKEGWAKVGVTPMIGQNDEITESFTIGDAKSVNAWALRKGIGLLSMWSVNRDSTCGPPLPKVSNITHNTCSGVDQKDQFFSDVLSANTAVPAFPATNPVNPTDSDESASPTPTPSAPAYIGPTAPAGPGDDGVLSSVDDPEKSPYPIWDPTTPYPIGVKVVWQLQVYQAKRWSTGFAPDTMVARPEDTPWRLIGPVAPGGEEPVPLPSVSAGTYPEWDPAKEYPTGSRIQMGNTPFVAKWWNQGKQPDPEGGTKHPWAVLLG